MAAQHNPHYPQRIGEPDCRDYLRTGRCKYGESCKYNHPPNVESGGGIKTPLDPSEPPFPIRPGEPPCQYYLKHGTCKFGQTCKFHHPPHVVTAASNGGLTGAVMMNVLNAPQGNAGQQIFALNTGDSGMGEMQAQVLQLLPQRPGEQDCIYFLRNGRCKYGATCKYHHPIDGRQTHRPQDHSFVQIAPQSRLGRLRSSSVGSGVDAGPGGLATVQFVPSSGGGHGSFNPRKGEPTHILVSEGPIRVMAINQGSSNRSANQYQHASNNSSPAITSTSVASSYETAVSSLDYIPAAAQSQYHQDSQIQVDSSGRYWRRTGSQEHLSSGGISPQASHVNLQRMSSSHHGVGGPGRMPLNPSNSMDEEGAPNEHMSSLRRAAEAGRPIQHDSRTRQASYGVPIYSSGVEGSIPPPQSSRWSTSLPSSGQARNAGRSWDDGSTSAFRRSSSPEEVALGQGNLSSSAPEYYPDQQFYDSSHHQSPAFNGRKSEEANRLSLQRRRGHDAGSETDDGLSKMTSALLTMLDTQDGSPREATESGAEESSYTSARTAQSSYHQDVHLSSGPSTPRQSGASIPRIPSMNDDLPRADGSGIYQRSMQYSRTSSYGPDSYQMGQEYRGGTFMPTYSTQPASHGSNFVPAGLPHAGATEDGHAYSRASSSSTAPSKWSPTWGSAKSPGREMEQNAQSVSALQQGSGNPNPSHSAHGRGLFLS